MARSRHGRTGGGPSPADSGLPSWAQRHLDEAGEPRTAVTATASASRHHRRGAAPEPSRLRGWGVAVVAVAAAVGSVPLAISSLANDHSGEPLPKVDTYTAGSPGPLQAEGGAARPHRGAPGVAAPAQDPSTEGVLGDPPGAPAAQAPGRVAAGPVPAAVVRPTPAVVPAPVVTKPVTPATPTTSTGQGRSATKPTTPTTTKPTTTKPSPKPQPKPQPKPSGGDSGNGGLVGGVLDTGEKAVNGLTGTVGGVLGGG